MPTVNDLLHAAMAEATSAVVNNEAYWDAVQRVQGGDANETWAVLEPLASDDDPRVRELVCDVLRGPTQVPLAQTLALFRRILQQEESPQVIAAIGFAFITLETSAESVALMLPFAGHADPSVRHGVVFALSGNRAPEAIAALIGLSADPVDEVRNWATFALGGLLGDPGEDLFDSVELRDALAARLSDSHAETRAEAVLGLAMRRDLRARGPVLEALEAVPAWSHYIEAARHLRDPAACDALRRLSAQWTGSEDWLIDIREAMDVCCPPLPRVP